MQRKIRIGWILLMGLFFMTGCWDKIEIDERAFIMAFGLDSEEDLLQVTYSFPNLPVITGTGSGGEKKHIKNTEGDTLLEANKQFNKFTSKKLTFDHARVVVFGDTFLQDDKKLREVLDYMDRSSEYAKSILLVGTDETAKEILENDPNMPQPTGIYIAELFNGEKSEDLKDYKTTLTKFVSTIVESNGNGILPLITYKDKEMSMEGIILLKDYKKSYILSNEQMKPFNWLRGGGKGIHTVKKVDYKEENISYEISNIARSIKFKYKNDSFDIEITIETEGDIKEYELIKKDEEKSIYNKKAIGDIEKELKKGLEEDMGEITGILQKEIGVDAINISDSLKMQNGKLYEVVKDDWDSYFTAANIRIVAIPHVRRIGMSK